MNVKAMWDRRVLRHSWRKIVCPAAYEKLQTPLDRRFSPRRGENTPILRCCLLFILTLPTFALETQTFNNTSLSFSLDPPVIDPARDALLVLTVTTPVGVEVLLPDLRERFRGFSRVEYFSKEPATTPDHFTRREIHWLLTPEPVPENGYSLRPFVIEVDQNSFATRPVVFPAAPLPEFVTGEIQADLNPIRIPPPAHIVFMWIGIGLISLALLMCLAYALKHLRRVVRERRMSPGERAYAELERLLQRGYVARGLYKEFYIELTHVVRRYIQRAHGIAAPVKTTEEFLRAAAGHPRFHGEVLQRLREFLESADLVKFAGAAATPSLAESSTSAARRYIESDASKGMVENG